jgi:hypothetical protein
MTEVNVMPQDEKARARYEHEAQEKKAARAESASDERINDERLRADNHTHQEGVIIPGTEQRTVCAADVKEAYDFLQDFTGDEMRRLRIVASGVRLNPGDAFVDLRDRRRGTLVAKGEETVDAELLVPKKETDYVLWDKLNASPEFEPDLGEHAARNDADPFPADENAPVSATYNGR